MCYLNFRKGFQAISPTTLAFGPSLVLKHVFLFSAQTVDFTCIVSFDFPQQPVSSARWHLCPILQMHQLTNEWCSQCPASKKPTRPGSVTKPLLESNCLNVQPLGSRWGPFHRVAYTPKPPVEQTQAEFPETTSLLILSLFSPALRLSPGFS